jgi:hypothetical protein
MNSCIVCPSSTHIYWWTLVLSVRLLLTYIDELLYCLSVFYSRILMNSCIVCPSSTHGYWWTIVLSVRLLLTNIDELFGVCPSSTHGYWWTLVLSVRLLLTDIDELLYCLSVFHSRILMNSCIVCPSSTQGYWLSLWCLQTFHTCQICSWNFLCFINIWHGIGHNR